MKGTLIILIVGVLILANGCNYSGEIAQGSPIQESQPKTKEEAEKTAERFARYWEQRDFDSMYDFFVTDLQSVRNKRDFVKFFDASETSPDIVIRLDKLSMDSKDIAYAYYTVSSSIYDVKAPAMKLEYIYDSWKINAFGGFFTEECAEECLELDCEESICSSETGFKCEYEKVEECSCNDKFDCPYDKPLCIEGICSIKQCKLHKDCEGTITQEARDDCESKGLRFYVKSLCSKNRCKLSCYELEEDPYFRNSQAEKDAKLMMRIFSEFSNIELNNYDVELSGIVIILNGRYQKKLDKIDSGAELKINLTEFLDGGGHRLYGSEVDSIYLYSQQGKWWD